jgi:hypothetical protein
MLKHHKTKPKNQATAIRENKSVCILWFYPRTMQFNKNIEYQI